MPVRFQSGIGHELDTLAAHPLVRRIEIVNPQKQSDATGELATDRTCLAVAVSPSKEQPGHRAGRPDHDPSLRPAVIGHRWRVLDELKTEGVNEEPDGVVVVVNDERDLFEEHAGSQSRRPGSRSSCGPDAADGERGAGRGRCQHEGVTNRLTGITIDCADPALLAAFWSMLLDRPSSAEHEGPGWATVGSRFDSMPRLTFQRVPEAKRGKVRLHLDVQVEDITDGRGQVEALGGQWTGQRFDYPGEGVVMVMTDVEGHEFCLVQYL